VNRNLLRILILIICGSSTATRALAPLAQQASTEQVSATSPTYELLPDLETIIEKYQSPEFIEEALGYAEQFENQDFIHRALHRRETALEAIDALNKKVLYEFPFFMRTKDKAIGICGCDVIALASHFIQKYLDRSAISNFITEVSAALAQETVRQAELFLTNIPTQGTDQISKILVDAIWQTPTSRPLLMAHLKRRLTFAGLEYVKKSVTPPPFFMHGKTKEAQANDFDAEQIAPVTSVLPIVVAESFFDPIINGLVSNQPEESWHNHRSEVAKGLGTIYALEGAKQLDLIGDIDETLFFVIAQEMATSTLFFHRELYETTTQLLRQSLCWRRESLQQLLTQYVALQKNTTFTADVRALQEKELQEHIKTFFRTILGARAGEFVESLHQAQRSYSTALTGALLAPVAFKVLRFGWKILNPANTKSSKGVS
jgi:hypothetical protein